MLPPKTKLPAKRNPSESKQALDKKKKEVVDIKNTAEMIIYTAEKALKDAGDKVPADLKSGVEAKITALKGVKDGTDGDTIKKATEELSAEMSKIGEAMEKANPSTSSGPSAPEEQPAEVKDAEFKETPPEGEAPQK